MLKRVHSSKSPKFTKGYEAEILNQSTFAALLLAREYSQNWKEICIISEGPYTADPFRLLGDYQVLEIDQEPKKEHYSQAIQEGREMGCKVFVITSRLFRWSLKNDQAHYDQKEPLYNRGLEAAMADAKLMISITSKKGYMLIEVGESKF